jgi:hypothetical protein
MSSRRFSAKNPFNGIKNLNNLPPFLSISNICSLFSERAYEIPNGADDVRNKF